MYRTSICLPARVEHVGRAREFVAATLGADHPGTAVLQLIVSELVTNSIVHSKSGSQIDGTVTLTLTGHSRRIRVAVTDCGGPTRPQLREVDFCAESGRGLHLVDALAVAWNCFQNPSRTVTTWAEVPA
ncbi:MAG TPA: ATP-binding protein [Streptosporangiaceae bacterium]